MTSSAVVDEVAPFPAWSITLAPALEFPRLAFADALEVHARLVEKHVDSLLFLVRKVATSQRPHIPVVDLTGVIVAGGDDGPDIRVDQRGDAAHFVRNYRGVLRPLLLRGDGARLPIVVVAQGVVSIRMATVDTAVDGDRTLHTLVVEPLEVAVEPLQQKHDRWRDGPLLVTRWVHPDGEARFAWVSSPRPPASDEEAIDRVLAQYDAPIRRRLWAFLSDHGAESEPLVSVMSVPQYGDGLDVVPRGDHAVVAAAFPTISSAITAHGGRQHVPVFVYLGESAALRWIALRTELTEEAPPTLIEPLRRPLAVADPEPLEDDTTSHAPDPRPSKAGSAANAWLWIIRMTCVDEIGEVLAALSEDELDREIARVGFEPKSERALGPGLRETVVYAIAGRRLKENPPEGV